MRHLAALHVILCEMEMPFISSCFSYPYSLRETGDLPSAGIFAECILSGTRQIRLYQVFFSALGKDGFAECFFSALGLAKMALPSAFFRHSAK